ncbi:MAG: hypothetical protein ACR2K1_02880 [Saprospiraceae bacterium]
MMATCGVICAPLGAQTQIGSDINGEAPSDISGQAVACSADGTVVAIGALQNDNNGGNAGHVRVYVWNGSAWVQRGIDLDGVSGSDTFGTSVALSADGTIVASGAPENDGNGANSGHVRVFAWNGSAWVQRGSAINGEAAGDLSGSSVSLSSDGTILAIGASQNDGNGSNAGHVRVFTWNGSSWVQRGADIDGEAANDELGLRAVSLSANGNILAVGGRSNDGGGLNAGHARVFAWNGSAWIQRGTDIDGENENDLFGAATALTPDGDILAVGANQNDGAGINAGHVRVYAWNGSAWIQRGADIDGEAAGDESGVSLSISSDGSLLAIGALRNDGNGLNAGHVRLYVWNGSAWSQRGPDIDGEAAGDEFGRSVALSADGGILVVGGPRNDAGNVSTDNRGHTRVFSLCPALSLLSLTNSNMVHATAKIYLEANPDPADIVNYSWTSSNTNIATVGGAPAPLDPQIYGEITGVAPGSATITYAVTLTDGCELSETFEVAVEPLPALLGSVVPAAQNCGSTVSFTVEVGDSFFDISGMQFSVEWDSDQLEFVSLNAPDINNEPVVTANGTDYLTFAWSDDPLATEGADLADGTVLISAVFKVIDNSTPATISITSNPTAIEATNAAGAACTPTVNAPVNLTVIPVTISPGAISPDCTGSTSAALPFTLPAAPAPQGNEYTIDFENLAISDVPYTALPTSPITLVLPGNLAPGVYTATLKVRLDGNCESTDYPLSITIEPDPTISISGGSTVCIGGPVTLTAVPAGGTGTCTIQWQSYDGANWNDIPGETAATYTPPTGDVGATQYRATYTCTGGGCDGAISGTQTVTVVADPTISISGGATVCIGGPVTLTAVPAGGVGTCTIQWQSYDGANWNDIPGETAATYTPHTGDVGATQYRATYTCTGGGCDGAISGTQMLTVVADPVLTPPILSISSLCPDSSSVISVTASGGTGTFSYQWQYFDGTVWTAVLDNAPVGAVYANASTPALGISGMDNPGAYPYRCIVTQSGVGCDELTSASATLTVTPCLYFDGLLIGSRDSLSGIANALVSLNGAATDSDGPTASAGAYHLVAPVASGNFTITPNKPWSNANAAARNASLLNGVDVADASRITQHVAASNFFADPEDLVAADVNRNNLVSTQDAALINQALQGRPLAFLQFNKSWRFIPTDHVLPKNPSGPPLFPTPASFWGFPESRSYTGVDTDQADQHFYGVKIGDVVATNANPAGQRPGSGLAPLIWAAPDSELNQDEEIEAVFHAHGFSNLAAVQFAIGFDTLQLEYLSTAVSPGLPFGEGAFGAFTLNEGNIRFAWSSATGASVQNYTAAYRLRFRVRTGGGKLSEVLQLDAAALPPVAYSPDLIPAEVRLRFIPDLPARPREDQAVQAEQDVVLYQNRPNPFKDQTTIGFMLVRAGEARLRVYNTDGRLLFENEAYRPAGYHEIDVLLEPAQGDGLLYYELRTPDCVLSRKMIARSNR